MSEILSSENIKILQVSSNVTLTNDNDKPQYILLKSDSTNTNHWRISIDTTGKLAFDRYNGTTWINKFQLE